MGMSVRIGNTLYSKAKAQALEEHRTIVGQIELWATIGRAALDNPELPINVIRDLLLARAEDKTARQAFIPEGKRS